MFMKILCFGGGTAVPMAVLTGLKKHKDIEITSVTSMVDSGGSTGQLRKDFGVLPPGDIMRHILTLSEAPQWKKELFSFRFGHEEFPGGHRGHSFGNVFIAGLEYVLKDYDRVLEIVHEFMEVRGRCLPATIKKTNVHAILENETIIEGEDEIDFPKKHDSNLKIKKIFLKPEVEAYPPVIRAISDSEAIVIGPGDLYSSILPCFLPEGITEAMRKTKAIKILICPPMTKKGETEGFSVSDFAIETEKYIGTKLDNIIYNSRVPDKTRIEEHRKSVQGISEPVKIDKELDGRFMGKDLITKSGKVVYDPDKLANAILAASKHNHSRK